MPEWQTETSKRGLREDGHPSVVHTKVVFCYVDKFCSAGVGREYAEAEWACYKANGTDQREILSLGEPHAFVRNLNFEPASNVPDGSKTRWSTGTLRAW